MANNKKVWTPELRTQFVKGQFKDYAGNMRDYVMAAVSIPADGEVFVNEGKNIPEDCCASTTKMLSIAVAVRCPLDPDNGMGERIAYGKATTPRSMNHVMFVTHEGMINTTMVTALLQQEAAHFEKNPGTYITAYDKDMQRYKKTGKVGNAERGAVDTENVVDMTMMPSVATPNIRPAYHKDSTPVVTEIKEGNTTKSKN